MPSVDFATTQIFIDDHFLDVSFEFGHDEVKAVVQRYKGYFQKPKKAWRIDATRAKVEPEVIVAEIRQALWDAAPDAWKPLVEKFENFACATRRYEVRFGVGGIRLIFPAGHACHYQLKKLVGRDTKLDTWLLPAKTLKLNEIIPMIKRADREDKEVVLDALEPYEGRSIKGTLVMRPEEASAHNIEVGKICFADFNFVHIVEPHAEDRKLHYWPFRVSEVELQPRPDNLDEVDLAVKFLYLEAEHACAAIRKYMSLPIEERPWPLDLTRATGRWKSKSS
jgi:hypothetical protein